MTKIKVGKIRHYTLVEGNVNELASNEVLISKAEGYIVLRKKNTNGTFETYVVMPLSDFKKDSD